MRFIRSNSSSNRASQLVQDRQEKGSAEFCLLNSAVLPQEKRRRVSKTGKLCATLFSASVRFRDPSVRTRSMAHFDCPHGAIDDPPLLGLGDGTGVSVSIDFRPHRGFARTPLARPKTAAWYPPEYIILSITRIIHGTYRPIPLTFGSPKSLMGRVSYLPWG